MASVRMVSIDSCSMSVFATKLLVETLLRFSRRTICLCPLLPRFEHLADLRLRGLAAVPLDGRNRCAAERRLLDTRDRDRARHRVREDLRPALAFQQSAAARHDLLDLG